MEYIDAERLKSDRIEEVKSIESHKGYIDEFFDTLSELKDIWDGHLGRINAVKHLSSLPHRTFNLYNRHLTELERELASLNETKSTKCYECTKYSQSKQKGLRRLY